jgi:aspartyl-tRNA(Asn)/glutamyl-tRNA(Gln) amidotransferase subunit A
MNLIDPYARLMDLVAGLEAKQFLAVDIVSFYLDRIRRSQTRLNAFTVVDAQGAITAAAQSDRRRASGTELSVLDGIPIVIKDMFDSAGEVCGCGAPAWAGRIAAADSSVVARLKRAGLCVLGRTQMVELAFGAWGLNPALGTPWNPWDLSVHRIPGGSSSGSAVAVAAGLAPVAIGSDTGGSVRAPAALNGVTGFKASHGLVDLTGALALSERLDSVGVLSRTVEDAAQVLSLLSDSDLGVASLQPSNASGVREKPLLGMQIVALDEQAFGKSVDEEIILALRQSRRILEGLGASLKLQSLPFDLRQVVDACGAMIAADGWLHHQSAMSSTPGLPATEAVARRLSSGRSVDETQYRQLLDFQRTITQTWVEWLGPAQAVLMPTVPLLACPVAAVDESSLAMGLFNRLGNFVGGCSVSLPAGLASTGLPMGVQLLAPRKHDAVLVQVGAAFQRACEFHRQSPDLAAIGL